MADLMAVPKIHYSIWMKIWKM